MGYILGAVLLLALFILYSVSLILTVFCLSRKGRSIREMKKTVIMNLGLGILSPCLVLHPKSKILPFTSLISALVHSMLCLSLLAIRSVGHHFQQSVDDFVVLCLVTGLILSLVPSSFLHWVSFEEKRQKFGLITCIGSLCCEDEDAFIWACKNNYPSLLALSKKSLIDPKHPPNLLKDDNGKFGKNNGVHVACIRGR